MEIEVLAPAGSYAGLRAAVNAGADAVYIGGKKYGARAYAKNPEEEELIAGIEYAHRFGVKVYMTLNTLLKDEEMRDLYDYVLPFYEAGVDALIVQDLGVMEYLMTHFPNVDIHASTQMSIMGHEAANKLRELGVRRVVPAREISMKEIRSIRAGSDIEIEGFVHGALCYSYSGQCFMSSLIGGRSANRGRCAGTCRLPFEASKDGKRINKQDENYLLSCKDLCSLDILPEVIAAGVDSLKIEGRMKSPRYTAGVVRIWRKYVDLYLEKGAKGYKVEPDDRKELLELYDRGGQTDGYYEKHNGRDMLVLKEKPAKREGNEALFEFLDAEYVNPFQKHRIRGTIVLRENEPICLTIRMPKALQIGRRADLKSEALKEKRGDGFRENAFEVTVYADAPGIAQKKAATEADIKKQICKTGNTFYEFEELNVDMAPNLFVPVKFLNEVRRAALEKLDKEILCRYRRTAEPKPETEPGNSRNHSACLPDLHFCAENEEQLEGIREFLLRPERNYESIVSFEADTVNPAHWHRMISEFHGSGARVYLYLPHIFRTEARRYFEKYRSVLLSAGFDGFIIRSLEESEYIKRVFREAKLPCPHLHFDYNLYACNTYAMRMNQRLGANMQTLSVEMNLKELRNLGGKGTEAIVYGRLLMMVSAQCIKKTTRGCDHIPEVLYLKDRQQEQMPVKNKCTFCYNHIYNAKPLSTLGISKSIRKLGVESVRLLFTTENKSETLSVLDAYEKAYIREMDVKENMELYTRGHYKRGIE